MKHKQTYLTRASFSALIFVILGYTIKFYPEVLKGFDSSIQELIRGNLPQRETDFFLQLTILGNTPVQLAIVLLSSIILYFKKWYSEAVFMMGNGALAAIAIAGLKRLYQRPRPSLTHLTYADGFSFPSGHSLGSMVILGVILIIIHQRLKHKQLKISLQILLSTTIFLIGLSRIYLGVHYPTDVLAGFTLGFGILNLTFPFYDSIRFKWRFQNKQA